MKLLLIVDMDGNSCYINPDKIMFISSEEDGTTKINCAEKLSFYTKESPLSILDRLNAISNY